MHNNTTELVFIQGTRFDRPLLPLGMAYIAEILDEKNVSYEICDINLMSAEEIIDKVLQLSPEFIAISVKTYEIEKNYQLLTTLKKLCPESTIILGGPHAIAVGMKLFEECPAVDVSMLGEGEDSLWRIVKKAQPLHSIPGVCTPNGHSSPPVRLDLSNRKFPTYRKFDLDAYPREIPIMSSRGCVYNCTFCGAGRFLGKKWRPCSAHQMFEEFEYWYKRGYRRFYFSDSLFALDKERVITFCENVNNHGYTDVEFVADGVRADHLSYELLKKMKIAGFRRFNMGVETIHPATLKLLKKGETFEQIDAALSWVDKVGILTNIYLIVGLPGENYADTIKSINYALRYKYVLNIYVGRLTPILGTPYYDELESQGLLSQSQKMSYPNKESFTDYTTPNQWVSANEFQQIEKHVKKIHNFCNERQRLLIRLGAIGEAIPTSAINAMTWLTPHWRRVRKRVKRALSASK